MSMVLCEDCGRLFDSDHDPDCFIETGNMRRLTLTEIVCEPCRWDREDAMERESELASKAEAEAEAIETAKEVYRG